MNILNFCLDFNHKFNSDYITTIRSWHTCLEKDIYTGKTIELTLNREPKGVAEVISVTPIDLSKPFDKLSPYVAEILALDTGMQPSLAYHFIRQMVGCKGAVVLLRR